MAPDVPALSAVPLAWRAGYRLLANGPLRTLASLTLRAVQVVFGKATAERLLDRFGAAVVWSGWPRRTRGWVNVHASSFYWQMAGALAGSPPPIARRPPRPHRPIRIGCFGPFSGLLGFQRPFFEARPADVEVYVYDVVYDGRDAGYLRPLVNGYSSIDLENSDRVATLAQRIRDDSLDALVNVFSKRTVHTLLELIDVPCVINVCTGSDLLHHDRVSFQIYPQPSADFFPAGDRLFCGVTQREVASSPVYDGWMLYDPRDIDLQAPPQPWRDREPLIVYHGSLYKLSSPTFLNVLFDLLASDSNLEFVFMGPDLRGGLQTIERAAAERGLSGRMHYQGVFSHLRGARGDVESPGWKQLCALLGRARLAPDPFPVGGGSARFEAYLLGTPTVHMGLRLDRDVWGQPQAAMIDLPALQVPDGTAFSCADYRGLCERALYEPAFADTLAAAQLAVARRLANPQQYWEQVMSCYERWWQGLRESGRSVT